MSNLLPDFELRPVALPYSIASRGCYVDGSCGAIYAARRTVQFAAEHGYTGGEDVLKVAGGAWASADDFAELVEMADLAIDWLNLNCVTGCAVFAMIDGDLLLVSEDTAAVQS